MNKRFLTITLSPDWKSALRAAAHASTKADYQGELLNFESPAQFFGQLTEKRWELVRLAQGKAPMAVRELARLAGRDVRRVHEDVSILTQLGLLERTDQAGVVCPYESVHIDMRLQAA
jgi:predicted transcriptional regulator